MLIRSTYLLCLLIWANLSSAQCGLDPVSGTTTVSAVGQIQNSYYPGTGNPASGATSIVVGAIDARGNASVLGVGDLVLIIQMQGADFTASNDDLYGNGVAGGAASGYLATNLQAGNYEYNSISAIAGSTLTLSYSLANSYYTRAFGANGKQAYQVIKIPRSYNITINSGASVTSPAWNGTTGGVVVLDAANVLTVNGSVTVAGQGFRGGGGMNFAGATTGHTSGFTGLTNTDFRFNSPLTTAANLTGGAKGEGIAGTPAYTQTNGLTTVSTNANEGYINGAMGRAAPGNAGGGGTDGAPVGTTQNQYNTGGGGGSNAGTGGNGGSGWHGGSGNVNTYRTGGQGGSPFTERAVSRFVMGGGGGAGVANNSTAANQYMCSGASGGGIILLRAVSYAGNGTLNANGTDATSVTTSGANTDAAGGGGAGGTIVAVTRANVTVGLNLVTATARGGKGGNMETHFDHGPGGGGGGGLIISNGTFASTVITGGVNGLTRTGSAAGPIDNVYGSTPGTAGQLITMPAAPLLKNAFNASSPCGTLPVKLESFNGTSDGLVATLTWKVDDAVNFSRFEVEAATDGFSFSKIGTVYYEAGKFTYNFSHQTGKADYYYRLKLINTDGGSVYSIIVFIRNTPTTKSFSVYPQPARDFLNISVTAEKSEQINLQLFNIAGALVKQLPASIQKGANQLRLENLSQLPAGIYTLKTMIGTNKVSVRVMVGEK